MEGVTANVWIYVILMIDAKRMGAHGKSKGHNDTTIDEKLVSRFHEKPPAYSSPMNWPWAFISARLTRDGIERRTLSDGLIDFKILTEHTTFPFHSVRTLANTLKITPATGSSTKAAICG
jgi:hypothetical protein